MTDPCSHEAYLEWLEKRGGLRDGEYTLARHTENKMRFHESWRFWRCHETIFEAYDAINQRWGRTPVLAAEAFRRALRAIAKLPQTEAPKSG